LDTETLVADGLAPPAVAWNDRLVVLSEMEGVVGAAFTVNVTSIVRGEFDAALDVTSIVAPYVPADSEPVTGCALIVVGAVPAPIDTFSQPTGWPLS
jgi:hypothetical protein